jgi:23S rRNA (cytosine1962-C5)-methyltransferase
MPAVTYAKVVLKPKRALPFFSRHPWVFSGAVKRIEGSPEPGEVVDLLASDGKFIARGLFNPHSNIKVRLYAWDEAAELDEEFWSHRLDAALALRNQLFPSADAQTAYRAVFSESDGLSGLVVDRYGDFLLVQFTSLALWQRREVLTRLLQEKCQPRGMWIRTEKGIRESEGLELADGLLWGEEPPRPVVISEHGVRFGVDVVEGQKTGTFLDQRDNRAAVARYTAGDRVLDLFCYAGGFGISALTLGNANSVLAADVSEPALTLARANAELNGVLNRIAFEKSEAYDLLEELAARGEKFDTVILDPPKMTRHRAGVTKALRGYHSLNRLAVDVLRPGGILVTCSCSGLVTSEEFAQMLAEVSLRSNRAIQFLEIRGQAPDHPVSAHCLETSYLKCFICRVI